jgi:methionyl-tRNA formyltransferase
MRHICVAGKNSIAVNAVIFLTKCLKIDLNYISVLTNFNDTGTDSWQPSLMKYANENGIKISSLEDVSSIDNLLFISLEYDKIISPEIFNSRDLFNIHFSLLPKYKGMYTSIWPILNGEFKSGVTLHAIDEGIDTGRIIDQIVFDLPLFFTSRDLYFHYIHIGFELFKDNIKNLLNNDCNSKAQDCFGSYYDKSSIDFNNICFNLNKTSFEIYNQIRAFIFKEYQLPSIKGYSIKGATITGEKINFNEFIVFEKYLILSGIDGFMIKCEIDD